MFASSCCGGLGDDTGLEVLLWDVVQGHFWGPTLELIIITAHGDPTNRKIARQNPTTVMTVWLLSGIKVLDETGVVPVVLLVCAVG